MDVGSTFFGIVDLAMREAALFAAAGFLILGAGDVAVDLIWLRGRMRRRRWPRLALDDLPPARTPGLVAVFVPAWNEADVIENMLRAALAAWSAGDYRLYVGCYPDDAATIAAVRAVRDRRIRLVIGPVPGPTTKADCLNRLWEALEADEATEQHRAKAVVLHDAEDVVHWAELRVFDSLIERFDFVQLPVLPLLDANSRWIGGHYADEFAEAHGKELVVRGLIGAALPSAGVGCAFSRDALARIAARSGGLPFDADSLTEDYELGLKVAAQGGAAAFVRIAASDGLVATREYFPGTIAGAVAQKTRWMTGIALTGWDRLGWSGGMAERWMRFRDRQALIAALLLFAGYLALLLWLLLKLREGATGIAPQPLPGALALLVSVNLGLLVWRLAMRFAFTTRAYGLGEGLRAIPRAVVSNAIAIMAASRAVGRYRAIRRTGRASWDKTEHRFPARLPAE